MNIILKQAVAAALALGAASLTPFAFAQSDAGKAAQPGVPMGPTKAGPNAAVTGSTTAAGNSGAPAQSVPATTAGTNAAAAGKPTSNTGPTKALSSADRGFMTKAAQDGAAEVETGKLAQANGANAEVKKFGERMQQDHTKAGDELKALAQSKGFTLPDKTDRTHARLAKQLQGLSGDKFDKVYAREAGVKDHKAAVALFTRQAQRGGDPDVKAFAQKTLPTLQEHLQMAQAMHDSVMAPSKR